TVAAMAYRHPMRGTQAAETVTLHDSSKTLADGGTGHVDELAFDKMVGGDLGTDLNHILRAYAEFGELALGLDIGHSEKPARRARQPLHFWHAGAELQRGIAVLLGRAMANDL